MPNPAVGWNRPNTYRLLVADDHHAVIDGIRAQTQGTKHITLIVAAEADSQDTILSALDRDTIDLVILDISLREGVSGIEILKKIKRYRPGVKVLINTVQNDLAHVVACLQGGADGYFFKGERYIRLSQAIQAVLDGHLFLSPAVAGLLVRPLLREVSGAEFSPFDRLSARQLEVLKLVAQGLANDKIGALLGVSGKTVANILSELRKILGVQTRAELSECGRQYRLAGRCGRTG